MRYTIEIDISDTTESEWRDFLTEVSRLDPMAEPAKTFIGGTADNYPWMHYWLGVNSD